ncbi:hypothetical protein BCR44DRAFT_285764, partial [Catenaria anguillulae PL171]
MPTNLMARLSVDGQSMSKSHMPMRVNRDSSLSSAAGGSLRRPLIFAPMQVVASDTQAPNARGTIVLDSKLAENIGKIVVELCTGKQVLRQTKDVAGVEKFKQAVLSEHQKKAVFVSHSAGFGEPIARRTSNSQYRYVCDKVVKRFIFEYASEAVHELSGRIPTPAPLRAVSAPPSPTTDRRTRKRQGPDTTALDREDVKAEQPGNAKTERRSKVKNEMGEGTVKRRRMNEAVGSAAVSQQKVVISLLDSDDDAGAASSSTSRRLSRRPTQPNEQMFVVSLLDSDD